MVSFTEIDSIKKKLQKKSSLKEILFSISTTRTEVIQKSTSGAWNEWMSINSRDCKEELKEKKINNTTARVLISIIFFNLVKK